MFEQEISRYEEKMKKCNSMTELLVEMSYWQSFCEKANLTQEQKAQVDAAYLAAEERLITKMKPTLW